MIPSPVVAPTACEARPENRSSDIVLARLMRLHPKLIDLTLDRVYRLLHVLGDPHRALPPVIHVAGTNGKGSVIAYLRAMIEAARRSVHVYTSPHLVRFHERIRLGAAGDPGRLVSEADLLALLEICEEANGDSPITYFEVTTVAALLAFARNPADALLLEVGLGGRLDATNVVDRPALTAITPVSLDHQRFLGDTLAAIAFEKAGILKPGVPAVVGAQRPEAAETILNRAAAVGAPVLLHGRDWTAARRGDRLIVQDDGGTADLPLPGLPGAHQIDNAGLAAICARQLERQYPARFGLNQTAIAQGVAAAVWPGRLHRLTAGPLVDSLPDGWELWLDGGHNSAAGQILAQQAITAWADRPLHLVAGMLNTKDTAGFLDPLLPRAATLHTVAIPGETNSRSAEEAAAIARGCGAQAYPAASVAEALQQIAARAVSAPTQTTGSGPRLDLARGRALGGAIGVETQWDRTFPRPNNRGKRSRAVSVPTETAGHEMSVGTQCDSAFPRFHDREKRSSGGEPGRILICGSLYLAGRVLALNDGD